MATRPTRRVRPAHDADPPKLAERLTSGGPSEESLYLGLARLHARERQALLQYLRAVDFRGALRALRALARRASAR